MKLIIKYCSILKHAQSNLYLLIIFSYLTSTIFRVNAFNNSGDTITKRKVYKVNYPVVGTIIGLGAISDVFAINRIKNKSNIPDAELQFLNSAPQRNLINPIDRWAFNLKESVSIRTKFENFSNYGMTALILVPGLLALNKKIRKDWLDLLFIYAEGHIITFTTYNYSFFGPTFQNRYRPVTYYSEFTNAYRENGNNRNSFYSGHVATCTYSTFFMAKVYCDYHPDMSLAEKCLWYFGASIPPVLIAYSRVRALDHFPSDCAIGFAIGSVIGIVIPQLHKLHHNKNLSLSMFTAPGGAGLSMRWILSNQKPITSIKSNITK